MEFCSASFLFSNLAEVCGSSAWTHFQEAPYAGQSLSPSCASDVTLLPCILSSEQSLHPVAGVGVASPPRPSELDDLDLSQSISQWRSPISPGQAGSSISAIQLVWHPAGTSCFFACAALAVPCR